MNPPKPTNAVVALADLLATTVQEYEQRLAGQQDALNAVGTQLKETNAALQASIAIEQRLEQRAGQVVQLARRFESSMHDEVQSGDSPQGHTRELVSSWLKEIVECLTPPTSGPNGGPNRPPT
jgi:hypothetical protein